MADLRKSKPPLGCCSRHPKHRQSPGVCSLCLRERLAQLSADRARCESTGIESSRHSSASSSPYYSSSSSASSSCSSPATPGGYRFTLEGTRSISALLKPRSAVCVRRESDDKRKGSGFWSKFTRSSKNGATEGPMECSRTRRGRVIASF